MLSPREFAVEVRDLLNAGEFAFDALRSPRVSVTDPAFSDEALQLAMNRAKRSIFRSLAMWNADMVRAQDSFTYPSDTESVRVEPPYTPRLRTLSRRPLRLQVVEDMTRTNYPLVVRRLNWNNRIAHSPGVWGALVSGDMSPYAYAERGGDFHLLPPLSGALDLRVTYNPAPLPIDIRLETPEPELPEQVVDWFIRETVVEAATKLGSTAALEVRRNEAKSEARRLCATKHVGPRQGNFTRASDLWDG